MVRYVGEPVAMVITDDRYQGEDAAELVSVDYDALPAVVGYDAALSGTTLLFPVAETNVAISGGAPADDSAFDGCEVVVDGPSRTSLAASDGGRAAAALGTAS
jgi:carbon-monoxide dehydrogenase large subunit